jgi:flagellar hook capping protein FlgD
MFAKHGVRILLAVVSSAMVMTSFGFAGSPVAIYDPATRTPYHWPAGNVNVYMDSGTNGFLTNTQSDNLTTNAMNEWINVATAYFSAINAGKIKLNNVATDITAANAGQVISYPEGHDAPNGGGIFVIYDSDGTICSNFFGFPPGVLGVSSLEFTQPGTPFITESWVVLNGAAIDPGDTSPYPGASFGGVYTHEFGHTIGLAHTQVNGSALFFGDNIGPGGCSPLAGTPAVSQMETMYPFIDPTPGTGSGIYEATVDQLDDVATLSDLYPTAGWPNNTGTITGKIFMPDGTSEVRGVNVIARKLTDPDGNCISAMSGDYTQGLLGPDGTYTLHGLTPGAQYLLYVDKIVDGFFSTQPTDTVFMEEYWNGVRESGNVDTDTTCSYVPITVGAGGTATANVLLNIIEGSVALGDDDAVNVPIPNGFSFCGKRYHSVWVNSNGNITFGLGDTNPSASANGLRIGAPRICGIWDDLDPSSGGVIAAHQVGQNFQIRFLQVPEIFFGGLNTFTITLRPNATIRVDYEETATFFSTVAGRSPGGGVADPGPTDLSVAPQPFNASTVYEEFFLGDDLTNVHLEYGPCGTVVGIPDDGVTARGLRSAPNPFRSSTTISFELPQDGLVKLEVFDISGRHVTTLANEKLPAGNYSMPWSGKDESGRTVAPGIYFYRLETPSLNETRKAIRIE